MSTNRVPPPVAVGCLVLLLAGALCSVAIFAAQPETAAGPCPLAAALPFSLEDAHALQQEVRDTFLSGQTGPFRLDVSSTALNSYVLWQTAGSPLYDPAVWFVPGRVCLRGRLSVLGPLQVSMAAAVGARLGGDQVRLDVEYARLGRWVLPGPVRGYLTGIANDTLQDARLNIHFTELHLADGHLIVAGTRQPPAS